MALAALPQVETDSVASLYAHVATGAWASVVPHTWLRAMPVTGAARAIRLVEPDTTAQISMAIHARLPVRWRRRAFLNVAAGAQLDDVFDLERRDFVADVEQALNVRATTRDRLRHAVITGVYRLVDDRSWTRRIRRREKS